MTLAITSYTPTTGPATGGTQCTITGTGLDTVTQVLVGTKSAVIIGTPTATSLTFRTPAGVAGAVKVTAVDITNDVMAQGATSFTYTAVTAPEALVTTLANKWRLDVAHASTGTTWVIGTDAEKVRGITTIKPGLDFSTEDDSDIDTGIDSATLVTGRNATVTATVKRGRGISSGNYDAGQEILRAAADAAGTPAGTVLIRWYDREGGPEAYQALALAQWSPQGGNKTGDKVDVTLNIQGKRTVITNPVIGTPALDDRND